MGRMVYLSLLGFCMGALVLIYRSDLKSLLPWEKIKEKRKNFEKNIVLMAVGKKKDNLEKELFASSVILKNMSLVRRESPVSADYIYERLAENGGMLRSAYGRMLTLYRTGHDEEAFKFLAEEIGTKSAKSFAHILSKLDRMNPAELAVRMEMFQETIIEKAMTSAMKKAQRNSAAVTACAALSVLALIINFVVVVVFADTMRIINQMFV